MTKVTPVSGEETQAKGADGARRAKLWLERTTRVNCQWVNPNKVAVPKLTFLWHDGGDFSFDLGGVLLGGDLDGQEFLAESKMYKDAFDQGTHYRKFLAQCYRAMDLRPDRCDNFMWITWSPFATTEWSDLQSPKRVRKAVLSMHARALGTDSPQEAETQVSDDLCKKVAERLWMIVLSGKQEALTLTNEHLAVVRAFETRKGAQ